MCTTNSWTKHCSVCLFIWLGCYTYSRPFFLFIFPTAISLMRGGNPWRPTTKDGTGSHLTGAERTVIPLLQFDTPAQTQIRCIFISCELLYMLLNKSYSNANRAFEEWPILVEGDQNRPVLKLWSNIKDIIFYWSNKVTNRYLFELNDHLMTIKILCWLFVFNDM